jgi:hypothetical protein
MSNDETFVPLEKRNSRRVMPPSGTEALLNGEGIALGHVQVKDISLGGMLICGNNTIEGFSKYSLIDDICINIPLDETVFDANKYLFMGEGKIVRSFTDEITQTRCYAVEFTYDSLYLTQRLMAEIEEISPYTNH